MNRPAGDCRYGLEQYEALRREATESGPGGPRGHGLALFLTRGMPGVVFSPSGQGAEERARMNGDPEAALDSLHGARRGRRLVLHAPALDKVQDLVGALVGALGPARSRQEAGNPLGRERRVRRIEGLAACPEGGGHVGDGPAVDALAAQHFVPHLHAIPSIEELMTREGLVLHALRARMQGAGRAERRGFGVFLRSASGRHDVTVIMYLFRDLSKNIRLQAAADTR